MEDQSCGGGSVYTHGWDVCGCGIRDVKKLKYYWDTKDTNTKLSRTSLLLYADTCPYACSPIIWQLLENITGILFFLHGLHPDQSFHKTVFDKKYAEVQVWNKMLKGEQIQK